MNQLISFTGEVLYLLISIIIFPLILLLHSMLGFWLAIRFMAAHRVSAVHYLHKTREAIHHMHIMRRLAIYRK